ncbi:DUF2789 domain-containing protein [Rheinheimera sp.]|uniref:DUF2789 domain-containing protein n=1 Tax=Rheinheimera sp. TaxID=1869214 RepID=UPI0027366DC8|nr:DUF2789 domain-containing protein [Rheinheimera sp.]MDP2716128.1 DUF2789 domain-containing protein [Rheinheimera sp.]
MDMSEHNLRTLFAQLGLSNNEQAIAQFIRQHRLAPGMAIQDAPFWNSAQASFLRESLKQDAEWCEIIDELNALLH